MKFKQLLIAGVLIAAQAQASERLVSYDLGSVDTLRALQAESQVVGLPKQSLPAYLSEFTHAQYKDVGSLKVPNAEAVAALEPSRILITGRQGDAGLALSSIAQTDTVALAEGAYWPAFEKHVMALATLVEKQAQGQEALQALASDLAVMKQKVAGQAVLTVTHNAGGFSVRQDPIATELLGMTQVALPDTVKPIQRGARTFMPVTVEDIAAAHPKVLYVVDRSKAIGQDEQALDVKSLQMKLESLGADTKVAYLSPGLWYLSGNGLESVQLQAKELTKAL
ncbi:ABC transporter substrate-binding protein [Marinomonas fungiae]|uniref:ABC-type enterochelin transport system, periplasmic component n=1 Tax=Marinomonas fungiae TaxID=1137284 RepID=A0A0K6IGM5_9GAMM|nr:ABC transporter substrate-binding protein [Marinomonas fungiae]CUB02285.1 ABC-type enterochelin transport system, periplasmic component [Marinomonas fungiae]